MTKDPELDDAIKIATERTAAAQTTVERSIEEHSAQPETTDVVVSRAEDLHVLAEEASGDPDASH
jgi:hypothetical protein